MYRLGGSHAQQDVLEQLFLDAAMKADNTTMRGCCWSASPVAVPLHRRAGYAAAAEQLAFWS